MFMSETLSAAAPWSRLSRRGLRSGVSGQHGGDGSALEPVLRNLVEANIARLFPGCHSIEVRGIELGPTRAVNENRFHRKLTVRYAENGQPGTIAVWLKFRPGLDRLFPVMDAYHQRVAQRLFPAPYFGWHSDDESVSLLATEAINGGRSLRDMLLRDAVLGRARRLAPVFRSIGTKLREFHDAFPPTEFLYAQQVAGAAAIAVRATPFLSAAEREKVLRHLDAAAERLAMLRLPAVRNHNDCILRNFVVDDSGTEFLIDCDSLRYRPNWRWYDLAFLLLNVESGCKWAPLLNSTALSDLWCRFWQGYSAGADGLPDAVTAEQLPAILYLVRLHWVFDGVVRRPNYAVLSGTLNERFRRKLKQSILAGQFTQLDFPM